MWLSSALLLGLSLAKAQPSVVVLPLTAEPSVDKRELTATVRALNKALDGLAFAAGEPVRPLAKTRRDRKDARRCSLSPECLSDLAYARGADLLGAGVLARGEQGFVLRFVVVSPSSGQDPLRALTEPIGAGAEGRTLAAERLVRRAFAPAALAGRLVVKGVPDGARVLVDREERGTLPLPGPIEGVIEGEHEVTVQADGYTSLTRIVDVRFRETTALEAVLRKLRRVDPAEEPLAGQGAVTGDVAGAGVPFGPIGLAGAGALALGVGAGFGVATLMTQAEVERRARAQQLVFPRDADLVRSGQSLSWVTNGLYLAGAALAMGAGVWFIAEQGLGAPASGASE